MCLCDSSLTPRHNVDCACRYVVTWTLLQLQNNIKGLRVVTRTSPGQSESIGLPSAFQKKTKDNAYSYHFQGPLYSVQRKQTPPCERHSFNFTISLSHRLIQSQDTSTVTRKYLCLLDKSQWNRWSYVPNAHCFVDTQTTVVLSTHRIFVWLSLD